MSDPLDIRVALASPFREAILRLENAETWVELVNAVAAIDAAALKSRRILTRALNPPVSNSSTKP